MIALDTNLLVYAHRSGTTEHRAARAAIEAALNGSGGCGIALPSIAEFIGIVTHPASTGKPTSPEIAAEFLASLQDAGIEILPPGMSFAARLGRLAADLGIVGARIFDLQIGLCALDGGATELWTRDRRFVKIPGLVLRDPFQGG